MPPRITHISSRLVAEEGSSIELACISQGFPKVDYLWLKEGIALPPRHRHTHRFRESGFVYLDHVQLTDAGKYQCLVNNSAGREKGDLELVVRSPLTVSISPSFLVARSGQSVVLNCSAFGHPINSISWLKDGKFLRGLNHEISGNLLRIRNVKRDDQGMYQCVVRNAFESVQATASILHGGQWSHF